MKPTYRKSWAWNLLMWSDLTLDPSFKVKRGYPNLKVLITSLLLVQEVCTVKPTCRKSWPGNLLMCSDLTWSPSLKVKLEQPNLKVFITRLLLILEVCNVKGTCRMSWAGNLLMSDLTFGPCFKVKQWFTGFGELSFWWIQIWICSPMHRCSYCIPDAKRGYYGFIIVVVRVRRDFLLATYNPHFFPDFFHIWQVS